MVTRKFDIESLLGFVPAKYLCENCYGLILHPPVNWQNHETKCPVCGIEYLESQEFRFHEFDKYMKEIKLKLEFNNLVDHAQKLALISRKTKNYLSEVGKSDGSGRRYDAYPPMRALFEALQSAQKFVHFTTYGISDMLLGAMKLTSQRVTVRGIVSGVENRQAEELTKYNDEAPQMNIKIFERKTHIENWDNTPHQKFIIIDGLIAFKGSANLTLSGWRKAAQGRDVVEIETDIGQVIDLHNRFFSRIWAEFNNDPAILMDSLPF